MPRQREQRAKEQELLKRKQELISHLAFELHLLRDKRKEEKRKEELPTVTGNNLHMLPFLDLAVLANLFRDEDQRKKICKRLKMTPEKVHQVLLSHYLPTGEYLESFYLGLSEVEKDRIRKMFL
jgi:hypothetical protein